VCDDWIDVPLVMSTLSGMCEVCLLVHGDASDKTLLVHPESSIDVSSAVTAKISGVQSKFNAN
jgi:serine/threonine-protein kinase RIO1